MEQRSTRTFDPFDQLLLDGSWETIFDLADTSFLFRVFLFNRKIHFCRLVFGHLSLLLIFFVTSWCKFHFCVDLTNCCSTTNYWDGLLKEVGLENKKRASLTRSILTSFTLCTADCVYKGKKHVCSGTKTKENVEEKKRNYKKSTFLTLLLSQLPINSLHCCVGKCGRFYPCASRRVFAFFVEALRASMVFVPFQKSQARADVACDSVLELARCLHPFHASRAVRASLLAACSVFCC